MCFFLLLLFFVGSLLFSPTNPRGKVLAAGCFAVFSCLAILTNPHVFIIHAAAMSLVILIFVCIFLWFVTFDSSINPQNTAQVAFFVIAVILIIDVSTHVLYQCFPSVALELSDYMEYSTNTPFYYLTYRVKQEWFTWFLRAQVLLIMVVSSSLLVFIWRVITKLYQRLRKSKP